MKPPIPSTKTKALPAAAAMLMLAALGCLTACSPSAPTPSPPARATLLAGTIAPVQTNVTADSNAYVSLFNEWLPPDKAKDPFYPNSTRRVRQVVPSSPQIVQTPASALQELVLRGISGPARHRSVIINDCVMEEGQEEKVKTLSGDKVDVTVVDVGDDYAVIKVKLGAGAEFGQKRLNLGQKRFSREKP